MSCGVSATTILGIDVGMVHLALAHTCTNAAFETFEVRAVHLINMACPSHGTVSRADCTLFHSGMACDRVAHVLQEHAALFAAADVVVIERQPPSGLRDVEQVFAVALRNKCVMMSPRTMHVALGSNGLPYDARKAVAVGVAERYVPDLRTRFAKADDVADAVCLALTYCRQQRVVVAAARAKQRAAAVAATAGLCLDAYRYKPH